VGASDGSSVDTKCLLGQTVTYTRRKKTSQCWNGEKFERPVVNKKCPCVTQDFQCEVGFARAIGSTSCEYGGQELMPTRVTPMDCKSTYQTPAYRKVPGDVCEGGWQPGVTEVPCPSTGVAKNTMKGLVLVYLVAGLLYVCYTRFRSGKQGPDIFGDTKASDCSVTTPIHMTIDCFRGLYAKVRGSNQGFEGFGTVGYKKVGNEFDLDVQEEALTDFIDEDMGHDDYAPRVYDNARDERPAPKRRDDDIVIGSAHLATDSVPKLLAPPNQGGASAAPAAHQTAFDMIGGGDEELL